MNLHTEIIDINGYALNIKEMWGLSNDSEDVYLKVDEICAKYGKRVDHFFNEERGKSNLEYINALIAYRNDFSKRSILPLANEAHEIESESSCTELYLNFSQPFDKAKTRDWYVENVRYNRYNLSWVAYRLDGRSKDMKEEVKGTYIHKDLVLMFMRWLDPHVAVSIDQGIKAIIKDYYNLKRERREATEMFWKFKEARLKYLPFESHEQGEFFDSEIMDAINITVLGCRASTFKRRKGVSSAGYTREWLSEEQLEHINWCQEEVCAYLKYYKMDDYKAIRNKLHDDYVSEFGVK